MMTEHIPFIIPLMIGNNAVGWLLREPALGVTLEVLQIRDCQKYNVFFLIVQ